MKKALSIIISLLLVIGTVIPAFAYSADQDVPIVYVRGQGGAIYDAEGNNLITHELDVQALAKQILEALVDTYATKNYDYAAQCLGDILAEYFPALSKDGELIADETPGESLFSRKTSDFRFNDFAFCYDWRLDPIYNSELLAAHIDRVLQSTGASKVALVGFSEGSCVCGAYLTYHGSENKVDSYTMISPGCNGIDVVGALAAGKCEFSKKTLDKFITYYVDGGNMLSNNSLEGLLSVTASLLAKTNVMGLGVAFLQDLYNGINESKAFSDIVLGCYPGFWSFVSDEYYDAAIEKNFGGREDEFAGLIAKIEKYHTEVYRTLPGTLVALKDAGMKLNVIAKYGSASFPIIKDNDVQSDGVIELHNTSFGARSAKLGETLSGVNAGDRYISPDKVVDASTCLFKDSTWFVQGATHNDDSPAIEKFTETLTKSSAQVTIDSGLFSQFLKLDAETGELSHLDENGSETKWTGNFLQLIINFFKRFFEVVRGFFTK